MLLEPTVCIQPEGGQSYEIQFLPENVMPYSYSRNFKPFAEPEGHSLTLLGLLHDGRYMQGSMWS
jgi:hypothetical protein